MVVKVVKCLCNIIFSHFKELVHDVIKILKTFIGIVHPKMKHLSFSDPPFTIFDVLSVFILFFFFFLSCVAFQWMDKIDKKKKIYTFLMKTFLGFEMTKRWIKDDRITIFGWTVPLMLFYSPVCKSDSIKFVSNSTDIFICQPCIIIIILETQTALICIKLIIDLWPCQPFCRFMFWV